MCLIVYSCEEAQAIELSFVLERIYQRRDGGASLCLDLLVRNTSNWSSLDRLRVLLPYALVDVAAVQKMKSTAQAVERLRSLRQEQARKLDLRTEELSLPEDKSNWIYRVVPHVQISSNSGRGKLIIERTLHPEIVNTVEGFIKRQWRVETPGSESFDEWMWLLYTVNNIALFDLVSRGEWRERLHPNEAMWIRVACRVPPTAYNRKPLIEKVFGRSLEYRHVFRSPGRICADARTQLEQFDPTKMPSAVAASLATVRPRALDLLPSEGYALTLKDWRVFLYREYGLGLKALEQQGMTARIQKTICTLPADADPPGCRRFPLPKWTRWLIPNRARSEICIEYSFGTDVIKGRSGKDDYVIDTTWEAGNAIYNYLTWLGFFMAVASLVVSVIALLLVLMS